MRAALLCALLSGCAAMPDSVRPELEHLSHATQHRPFTSDPTDYAADILSLVLHWDVAHWQVEVAEGLVIERCKPPVWCGEIMGPREQFQARVQYVWAVPK